MPLFCNMQKFQEEEQQVSSAGSFVRSALSLSSFFCFPCQKQLGPELSLHLRALTVVSQIIQRSVKPIRLSKLQSDWDNFLLYLSILILIGDLQLSTLILEIIISSLFAVYLYLLADVRLWNAMLPTLCSSLTCHSQALCSTSLALKSPQITKTMKVFIPCSVIPGI